MRLPNELKEQYREEFEENRSEFEENNQGAFDLLYPCNKTTPELHDSYN